MFANTSDSAPHEHLARPSRGLVSIRDPCSLCGAPSYPSVWPGTSVFFLTSRCYRRSHRLLEPSFSPDRLADAETPPTIVGEQTFDYSGGMGSASREGSSTALPTFHQWRDERTLRLFTPPRPVEVLTDAVWPHTWRITRTPASLWVRANGVRVESVMPAEQLAWLRASDGTFLAVIQMRCTSANGHNHILLPLTVESSAVRPHPQTHVVTSPPGRV